MAAALAFLRAHPGQVSPITLAVGADDVFQLVNECQNDSGCIVQGLPAVLARVSADLNQILGSLRAAAPDSEILVLRYYDPYAAAQPISLQVTEALNAVISAAAGAADARVADTFTPFNLTPPQPQTLCALTLFCTPLHDIHPSDAGYQTIAQQFWAASDYARLTD
jgi:lysophospholipase L1-like esterase